MFTSHHPCSKRQLSFQDSPKGFKVLLHLRKWAESVCSLPAGTKDSLQKVQCSFLSRQQHKIRQIKLPLPKVSQQIIYIKFMLPIVFKAERPCCPRIGSSPCIALGKVSQGAPVHVLVAIQINWPWPRVVLLAACFEKAVQSSPAGCRRIYPRLPSLQVNPKKGEYRAPASVMSRQNRLPPSHACDGSWRQKKAASCNRLCKQSGPQNSGVKQASGVQGHAC